MADASESSRSTRPQLPGKIVSPVRTDPPPSVAPSSSATCTTMLPGVWPGVCTNLRDAVLPTSSVSPSLTGRIISSGTPFSLLITAASSSCAYTGTPPSARSLAPGSVIPRASYGGGGLPPTWSKWWWVATAADTFRPRECACCRMPRTSQHPSTTAHSRVRPHATTYTKFCIMPDAPNTCCSTGFPALAVMAKSRPGASCLTSGLPRAAAASRSRRAARDASFGSRPAAFAYAASASPHRSRACRASPLRKCALAQSGRASAAPSAATRAASASPPRRRARDALDRAAPRSSKLPAALAAAS
mmetsp:Transcript_7248/g.25546  ORF Transcript_7248/g.25546 Transcript_7248/m.25546 type:complete len:303 (-) Transcript_7248:116-1024(-)